MINGLIFSQLIQKSNYDEFSNPKASAVPETILKLNVSDLFLSIDNVDDKVLKTVILLGLSRQVVDIWNEFELSRIRKSHIENYSPNSSEIISSRPNPLFPHFEMTLYLNSNK